MKYIMVTEPKLEKEIKQKIIDLSFRVSGSYLMSLTSLTKAKDYNIEHLGDFRINTIELKKYLSSIKVLKGYEDRLKLFIDSGGYSIIKGNIPFSKTYQYIGAYHYFLENCQDIYDAIFSLDIPKWSNNKTVNTEENVREFNKISLKESKNIIRNNPTVQEKFYFVWQFARPGQLDIWDELYEELKLNELIKARAIGGLVGLRSVIKSKIRYSLFIDMAVRCFHDHINSPFKDEQFRLHFLGVYQPYDRFAIALLSGVIEALTEKEPLLTYDTKYYFTSALYNTRDMQICCFDEHKNLEIVPKLSKVSDEVVNQVYGKYKNIYEDSINRINQNQELSSPEYCIPLLIYSNRVIDEFFTDSIKLFGLSEKILMCKSEEELIKIQDGFMSTYISIHHNIFKKNQYNYIKSNIKCAYSAFSVYKDRDKLTEKINKVQECFK